MKQNDDDDSVQIMINQKAIPLNTFAKAVVKNVIMGLISSLKVDEYPREIKIEIKV